jgi:hypothetical protein
MNDLIDFIKDTWNGFIDWVQYLLVSVLTFIKDMFLNIFELVLDGAVYMFTIIEPPEFLTNGLSNIANDLPSDITYFLSQSGLAAGLAIYGAGVSFRLLRKLFTLGQW